MALFDWLKGRKAEVTADEELDNLPWDRHPSIFEHIKAHIRPNKKGLDEGGETLPDDERLNDDSQIRWAAGARDGVTTHHVGSQDHDQQVAKLLDLVLAYCNAPTVKNKLAVYQFVLKHDVIGWIDQFTEALGNEPRLNHERFYELVKSLTMESPDREPVKFGVAILGSYRQEDDQEIFHVLGRHDEFTVFCAVALHNCSDDAEAQLWKLARNVDGWGRISIVERMTDTENPEIKDWLLREGYKNSIMYEYLAYTCATTGGLLAALERETVDDELLTSAAELIHALLNGGPATDINGYDDGCAVVERFLEHMDVKATSLTQLLTVVSIRNFLKEENADWEPREQLGWTSEARDRMQQQCSTIIERPEWRQKVIHGLEQSDDLIFYEANTAAAALKIDTWPYHWQRLQASPTDSGRWYHVMAQCDDRRIADAITIAEKELPLAAIASGPADEMGFGPGFEGHSCLDFILQELGRFPGHGAMLIEAGLQSPTVRNRNMALKTLSEWGRDKWPDGMVASLKEARAVEPNDDVRKRIADVIAGKPLE